MPVEHVKLVAEVVGRLRGAGADSDELGVRQQGQVLGEGPGDAAGGDDPPPDRPLVASAPRHRQTLSLIHPHRAGYVGHRRRVGDRCNHGGRRARHGVDGVEQLPDGVGQGQAALTGESGSVGVQRPG